MFECVQICSVSDTLHALQRSAAGTIYPVQHAQRSGVCVVPCVVCLASGTACPAACAVQSVRVRWGLGLHLWGIWGEPGGGAVDTSRRKNSKKAFFLPTPSFLLKKPYPLLSISKISRKNKKTPTKGLRSVLYLPYKP